MRRTGLRRLPGPSTPRWLRWTLGAASAPLLAAGCAGSPEQLTSCNSLPERPLIARSHPLMQSGPVAPSTGMVDAQVVQASHVQTGGPELPATPAVPGQPLPIDLETVLRLAEEQNPQLAVSREKVHESLIEGQGSCCWMPKVSAGVAYYRHEGGIQNPDGTFVRSSTGALYPGLDVCGELDVKEVISRRVNADRKIWQNKGELSRLTSEQLLEATTTYIDLLTARQGEAVSRELERYAQTMLKRAEDLQKNDRSTSVLYEGVQAEVIGRQQNIIKLKQQGDAAAAKLAYLLGLPCDVLLVPVDLLPGPMEVVDANPPCSELVGLALTDGPGIQELQGMLATIQVGMAQLDGPLGKLPTLQINAFEGPFGAGPGSNLTWDNRFDVGVQARYDLTALLGARQQQCLAQSRLMQVELSYQELRAKLTAGVQEARSAVLAGRPQIGLGSQQLHHASESYRLSELRVKENAPGATVGEVMTAIRALEQAHHGYLSAVGAHNKAQVRLLMLLGPGAPRPPKIKPASPPVEMLPAPKPADAPKPAKPGDGPRPIKEVSLQPVPGRR